MGTEALRDKVAIIGMGCTRFGALQEKSFAEQGLEAINEALADAGLEKERIEAAWLATFEPNIGGSFPGYAGDFVADILGMPGLPVSRVSNYCATGMDALRNAAFAVAAGIYGVALVLGNEKMRDVASRDSLVRQVITTGHPIVQKGLTAPGLFGLMARRHLRSSARHGRIWPAWPSRITPTGRAIPRRCFARRSRRMMCSARP